MMAIILRLLLVGVVLALSVCGAPTTEQPTEPTSAEPTSSEPTSTGNSTPITPTEERNCTTPTLCEFASRYQHQRGMTAPSFQICANVTLPEESNPRGQFYRQMDSPRSTPQNQVCGTVNSSQIVDSSCRWNYACDYNAKRIPPYIFHAECTSPITEEYDCRTVTYPVPALYTTGCDIFTKGSRWEWRLEQIAVACVRVPPARPT